MVDRRGRDRRVAVVVIAMVEVVAAVVVVAGAAIAVLPAGRMPRLPAAVAIPVAGPPVVARSFVFPATLGPDVPPVAPLVRARDPDEARTRRRWRHHGLGGGGAGRGCRRTSTGPGRRLPPRPSCPQSSRSGRLATPSGLRATAGPDAPAPSARGAGRTCLVSSHTLLQPTPTPGAAVRARWEAAAEAADWPASRPPGRAWSRQRPDAATRPPASVTPHREQQDQIGREHRCTPGESSCERTSATFPGPAGVRRPIS